MTFEQLYNKYWEKIFRLCMGYINDHAIAQDMTQDIFVIVWQRLSTFREEANAGTWIYRIATNFCLRQVAIKNRFPQGKMPIQIQEEIKESIEPQVQFLYQCISELSEIERIIISLELENIKQTEIAKIVGISEANVRVKIHRIKEKLTHKFKQNEQQ